MIASSEEKRIYDELVKAVAAYRATVQEVVALAKAGKNEEVQQIRRTTWVKAADQVRDQTDALQKLNAKGADATTSLEWKAAPGTVPLAIAAWLVVGIPLAWGVWVTLQKTAVLFH